jgi:hypothetical protein
MFKKAFRRLQILGLTILIFGLSITPGQTVVNNLSDAETGTYEAIARPQANPFIPLVGSVATNTAARLSQKEVVALAKQFDNRSIKFSAFSPSQAQPSQIEVNKCKALVEKTLKALPADLTKSLDNLHINFSTNSSRGLSNSHFIELRCANISEDEMVSVFVHELGHITDLGYLRGKTSHASGFIDGSYSIPKDDPSVSFYTLSWLNAKKTKTTATRADFISGYAMSDPFEDFAESFDFYVLHGTDFRALTTESTTLQAKYNFLRDEIFAGKEFDSKKVTQAKQRVWDSTLLPYNRSEFFTRG